MGSVPLCGWVAWSLLSDCFNCWEISNHPSLCCISGIGWSDRVSKIEVRYCVLGSSSEYQVYLNFLIASRVVYGERFSAYYALFYVPFTGWKNAFGDSPIVRQRGIRKCTTSLGKLFLSRFRALGPENSLAKWLEIMKDVTSNREQRRPCCHFMLSEIDWNMWVWILRNDFVCRLRRSFLFPIVYATCCPLCRLILLKATGSVGRKTVIICGFL